MTYVRAEHIELDNDEGRFIMRVHDVDGNDPVTLDIHDIALELHAQVVKEIGPYAAEAAHARATMPPSYEPGEAYSADDPKHPDFHDAMADLWDSRKGK